MSSDKSPLISTEELVSIEKNIPLQAKFKSISEFPSDMYFTMKRRSDYQ